MKTARDLKKEKIKVYNLTISFFIMVAIVSLLAGLFGVPWRSSIVGILLGFLYSILFALEKRRYTKNKIQ